MTDIFDLAFRKYGGRLSRDILDPEVKTILDGRLEFFRAILHGTPDQRDYRTAGIEIDYVDNATVNAVATEVAGRELVALFLGTTMFVWDALAALLTIPEVYPGVGNSAAPLTGLRQYLLRPQPRHFLDFDLDADRLKFAETMSVICEFFVFGHEVGHIVNGHLRYLRQVVNTSELVEFPAAPLPLHDARNRRLLELDADRHGLIVSLNWWGRWADGVDSTVRQGQNLFYVWAFAITVLMHLWDRYTQHPSSESAATHPMADVRLNHVFLCGYEEVMKRFPERIKDYENNFIGASEEVKSLWRKNELPAASFTDWRTNTVEEYVSYWIEWEKLKVQHLDVLLAARADDLRSKSS